MASVVINGDTSGSITLSAPAVAGTNTLSLPANTGTIITTASTGGVSQAMLANGVAGNGPAFSAYGTVAQSFPTSTFIKVNFDTEEFDTNNNFASSRFTPTVAGYYQINATTSSSGTGTSGWATTIYKNGTGYGFAYIPNASIGVVVAVSRVIYLNGSTDYVEIYAINNNATQDNQVGISYSYFTGAMVRAA